MLNINLKNFKKNHKNKQNQILYTSLKSENEDTILNLIKTIQNPLSILRRPINMHLNHCGN